MTKECALTYIDWLIKEGVKFSEKEVLFIKGIQRKSLLSPLSVKQEKWVSDIYARKTGGGDKLYHENIK